MNLRTVAATLRVFAPELFKLTTVVTAVVSLTLPLLATYYVQRTYDTIAYSEGLYQSVSEVEVYPEDLERVKQDFGSDVYLSAPWHMALKKDSNEINSMVRVTATPENTAHGWFPTATRRAYKPVESGENWIDLNTHAARELGVDVGDEMQIFPAPDEPETVRVRAIHDQRLDIDEYIGQVWLGGFPINIEGGDFQSELLSSLSPQDADKLIADSFYISRLEEAGYTHLEASMSRQDLLQHRADLSTTGIELVLIVGLLAAASCLFFLIRESLTYTANVRSSAAVLESLGVGRRTMLTIIVASGAVALAGTVSLGALMGTIPFRIGPFAPAFPAFLTNIWVFAAIAMWLMGTIAIAVSAIRAPQGTQV